MMSAWQWFGERKGLATGILMAGFALGPSVQSMIAEPILGPGKNGNHTNPKLNFYPVEVADNVPKMFNTLVKVWCGIWIFAVLLIHENPEVKINK